MKQRLQTFLAITFLFGLSSTGHSQNLFFELQLNKSEFSSEQEILEKAKQLTLLRMQKVKCLVANSQNELGEMIPLVSSDLVVTKFEQEEHSLVKVQLVSSNCNMLVMPNDKGPIDLRGPQQLIMPVKPKAKEYVASLESNLMGLSANSRIKLSDDEIQKRIDAEHEVNMKAYESRVAREKKIAETTTHMSQITRPSCVGDLELINGLTASGQDMVYGTVNKETEVFTEQGYYRMYVGSGFLGVCKAVSTF